MRRKKFLSVFGAMALTMASVAGCSSGGNDRPYTDVTRPAVTVPDMASQVEERYLNEDDKKITELNKAFSVLVSKEEYYEECDEDVELRVSSDGKITIEGMNSKTEDALKYIYKEVTGNENGPILFLSKAYKEGGDTVIKIHWNESLDTWQTSGPINRIEGSKYFREIKPNETTQEDTAKDIAEDDETIRDVFKCCCANLADEKYYTDADDAVKVIVKTKNKVGEITVEGLKTTQADFIVETIITMTGKKDGKIQFKSDEYEGATTVISFDWDGRLYTWMSNTENDVKGSRYYKDPSETEPETETEPQSNSKTTIEVMSFTNEVPNMIRNYLYTHPDFDAKYEVNFTVVATDSGAYQFALDQLLRDGDPKAPDLYMAESAFVKKYTTGSASSYACTYEDLGISVEQRIREAGIAAYSADITRRADGKVVALTYQGDGCAFIYNRDVAQDIFGDDKPETIEAALGSDWDSFFEAAEKCKQKGYSIVSGASDIWASVENSADHGWVVDGKLYIDPKREAFIDYSRKMYDNDYSNDTWLWTEGWFADMAEVGPRKVLGFYAPTWFINYTLTDHCGYWVAEDGQTVKEMGTYGRWGACRPNVGAFWGGTWLVANKKVLNDPQLKEGVRELIEYITLDTSETGLQYEIANGYLETYSNSKDVVPSRVVMEKSDGCKDILGGQDPYPVFIEANEAARGDNQTEYDEVINMYWRDAVREYTYGSFSREEAIQWFKDAVKENLPYFTVE